MCFKCSKKVVLIILLIHVICSLLIINWLKSYFESEDIECDVSNQNIADIKLQSEIELNFKMFLNNHSKMNTFSRTQNWTEVGKYTYIYSVYYDECPSSINSAYCVKFIGMTLNSTNPHAFESYLKCAFKKNSLIKKGFTAFVERLPENHFLPFTAAFFYCDLENNFLAEFVSLYDNYPSKWFRFPNINFKKFSNHLSLSLCVRPLYGHFSNLHLTQFLAYYTTTGVKHFIFYNYNASKTVLQYLEFFSLKNEISLEIVPWDVPLSNDEIHEFGQVVFTQDCFARNKYKYSHTLTVDLDEFVVPKKHHTISEFLYYLDRNYPNAGSWVIPMVLFCDEYSSNGNVSLPILTHNKRQATPWYHRYRSKYIARPDRIKVGGIHFIWTLKEGFNEVLVSPSLALLHHYKSCCNMVQTWFFHLFSFPVLRDKILIDNSLIGLSEKILNHSLIQFIIN